MHKNFSKLAMLLFSWSSVFQAAALINLGSPDSGYPVSPYFVAQLLVSVSLFAAVILAKTRLSINVTASRRYMISLLCFIVVSVASSLIFPRIFEGLGVYSPRGGLDDQYRNLTPLKVTASQLAQAAYLVLNLLCLLYFVIRSTPSLTLKFLHLCILSTVCIVVFFGSWQVLASLTGAYFPNDILYSASSRSQGFEQSFGGMHRINSTFPEASYLGAFLVASLAYLLRYTIGKISVACLVLTGLVSLMAIASTSTSAYLGLGVLVASYAVKLGYDAIFRGLVNRKAMLMLSLVGLALGFLVYLINTNRYVGLIYDAAVTNKTESDSFVHRSAADATALNILLETYGWGVGLGANRPSSFAAYLLSNVGVLGSILFCIFVFYLFRAAKRAVRLADNAESALIIKSMTWGLGFCLVGMVVAVPDLSFPSLWAWIVLLAAGIQLGVSGALRPASFSSPMREER